MPTNDPYGRGRPSTIPRPRGGGGEPIPSPGFPPGGIPPYLRPINVNQRDILALLQSQLDADGVVMRRFLYSTWEAQREPIKYQELRNAIRDGQMPTAYLDRWRQEYSTVFAERFPTVWEAVALESGRQMLDGIVQTSGRALSFPLAQRGIGEWIARRGAELAVNLSTQQQLAIRAVLVELGQQAPMGARALARFLRPIVGLTERGALAVTRYRQALIEEGLDARQVEQRVQNYAARLERVRADRIARTEISFAYNQGQLAGVDHAIEQGNITGARKRLLLGNEPCSFCRSVAANQPPDGIPVDESFPGSTGRLPNVVTPPLHPNCVCAMEFFVIL